MSSNSRSPQDTQLIHREAEVVTVTPVPEQPVLAQLWQEALARASSPPTPAPVVEPPAQATPQVRRRSRYALD